MPHEATKYRVDVKDVTGLMQDNVRAAIDTNSEITKTTGVLDLPKAKRETHVMRMVRVALCLYPWTTEGLIKCVKHLRAVEGIVIDFPALRDMISTQTKREELRILQRRYLKDMSLSPVAFRGYRVCQLQKIAEEAEDSKTKVLAWREIREEMRAELEEQVIKKRNGIDDEELEIERLRLRSAKLADEQEVEAKAVKELEEKYGPAGSDNPDKLNAQKQKPEEDDDTDEQSTEEPMLDISHLTGHTEAESGVVSEPEGDSNKLGGEAGGAVESDY